MLTVQTSAQAQSTEADPRWKLVWSDDFSQPGRIDPDKWEFETGGGGWGNSELEHYTDRLENVRQEKGHLVIEARRENYQGDTFTSGRIHTKANWKYAKVEVRAKMPGGHGTWPAIWMMPERPTVSPTLWPDNGELDIMEHVGRAPDQVMSCFYTKNFNWMNNTGKIRVLPLKTATTEFHTYTFEWNPEEASYAVDGVVYHVFKNPKTSWEEWPYDQKYHLILNMAMGGFGGDVDPSIHSRKFLIDSVKVYQRADFPESE